MVAGALTRVGPEVERLVRKTLKRVGENALHPKSRLRVFLSGAGPAG
jgi:hypothetical protein